VSYLSILSDDLHNILGAQPDTLSRNPVEETHYHNKDITRRCL